MRTPPRRIFEPSLSGCATPAFKTCPSSLTLFCSRGATLEDDGLAGLQVLVVDRHGDVLVVAPEDHALARQREAPLLLADQLQVGVLGDDDEVVDDRPLVLRAEAPEADLAAREEED